jgi:malonyl-CoA O-methyltransferase
MPHLPVEDAYDRWSASYDGYDNPMVWVASQVLRSEVAPAAGGRSVFEFGCGTGRNLAVLRSAGAARLAGCDFSEGMLGVARSRGLEVFRHDIAQPLPPGIEAADVALFSLALEHVSGLAVPLREAKAILRPGGRVVILEIHPFLSLGGVAAHFEEGGEEVTMPTYPHRFSDYLAGFAAARLRASACREWRPRDLDAPPPAKAMKRGPDFPMLVHFELEAE